VKPKLLVSWSSGKDSAWALHVLRQSNQYEIAGLLTTINSAFDRVAMHGVRRELVEAQAEAAGLPLWKVPLPWPCSNQQYESAMAEVCTKAIGEGIQAIAFGDLFLEDVRQYREDRMRQAGLTPIFPLWKLDTAKLVREMWTSGLRSRIVCLDPKKLAPSFAGRDMEPSLLSELSPPVDPCGENGEFHTFVYEGPMFTRAIPIQSGETVTRDGFVFTDVLLRSRERAAL
jgi:uncharacterized protein (TIGR00290 family)